MSEIICKDINRNVIRVGDTVLYARKTNYSANGTLVQEKVTNIYQDDNRAIVMMGRYKSTSPETQLYKLNTEVFLLLADDSGTTFSQERPFGYAITNEEEAQKFISGKKMGYTNSYEKLKIVNSSDEVWQLYQEEQKKKYKNNYGYQK